MIFVCTGSQVYQFNRLLKELDRLVAAGEIKDEVFAQIGDSDPPVHLSYERFLDRERFAQLQQQADLIISHAGTGALIGALKKGKKVISVPRLAKFGEHIDDHQLQVSGVLAKQGYLWQVLEIEHLGMTLNKAMNDKTTQTYQRESKVLSLIEDFLVG